MFVLSVKTSKRRLITAILCCSLIAAMLVACVCFPTSRTMIASTAVRADNDEACAAFLKTLGYTVELPAVQVKEIRLPDTFDDTMSQYNALQAQAGYDLSAYAGQRVKYRTYHLAEHPEGVNAQVNVYIYDGCIIGGDVTSLSGNSVTPLCKVSSLTC